MKIPHILPESIEINLGENQKVIVFHSDVAAQAFTEWWSLSYEGGSEAFAQWVQKMQVQEARYPGLIIEESEIVSWDEEDPDFHEENPTEVTGPDEDYFPSEGIDE